MKLHSKWVFHAGARRGQVRRIAAGGGADRRLAAGAARGVTEPEAAKAFLTGGLELMHEPRLLPDMDKAAARVVRAVRRGEKVAVYGDYDVDGQTSTALLVRGLSALGFKPDWYIPERVAEGYGLNGAAVDELARAGVQLLITVDCGIQGNAEVERPGPRAWTSSSRITTSRARRCRRRRRWSIRSGATAAIRSGSWPASASYKPWRPSTKSSARVRLRLRAGSWPRWAPWPTFARW